MLIKISQFVKSYHFAKGLLITLSAISAFVVSSSFLGNPAGLAIAFGTLLASVPDIPGNKKHRFNGIVIAILIGVANVTLIHLTHPFKPLFIITLAVLTFCSAYISVYGFRASLVALSALLAIAIGMARIKTGFDIFIYSGYTIIGGLWYLSISSIYSLINPTQYSVQLLTECLQKTAAYLNLRSELIISSPEKREELLKKLLELQTELTENHESLRSVLLNTRINSGSSNYIKKQLLIFIELIDILELGIANPIDYTVFDNSFKAHRYVTESFADVSRSLSQKLEQISHSIIQKSKKPTYIDLDEKLLKAYEAIEQYKSSINIEEKRELIFSLRHLYDYAHDQSLKVLTIERILHKTQNTNLQEKSPNKQLITVQDYSPSILKENFSFKSPIFKHSLRLSVTVLIGFLLGSIFSLQNAYWIILTIIVIMRPNYGLTKERSKHRIIGTILGGLIAAGIIMLNPTPNVYVAIVILSMIFGFSFVQQNYRAFAVCITLNIVFLYALLQPNAFEIIQFRVIDTLIGAVIAIIANHTLWPAWEFYTRGNLLSESIKSNIKYLEEVKNLYNQKTRRSTSYIVSRKEAFIALGNLVSVFQRMAQEPKSKQKNILTTYETVVIQHTFLSSAASLGTYIQNHETTAASNEFNAYVNDIVFKLKTCISILNNEDYNTPEKNQKSEAISQILQHYENLILERKKEVASGEKETDTKIRKQLQEAHLVIDQLQYLDSLTDKLKKTVFAYQKENP